MFGPITNADTTSCLLRTTGETSPGNFSPTALSIQLNVSMDHAILGMNSSRSFEQGSPPLQGWEALRNSFVLFQHLLQ